MGNAQLRGDGAGKAHLSGQLTFKTVPPLAEAVDALFEGVDTLEIELSGISLSDSGGLALLVSWQRRARLKNKKIVFTGLPRQLLGLVQVSGVEKILIPDDVV